ncbi:MULTISPECIES: 50S ribosomal protein L25/general stress protein Ctc [Zoogloea]|jgi:large subunit ribosomal protein L25|uniref:Large ribosomal subunit protein bL25 n=1 Tax=Zoogloea oleivorans TaxID=1552750 RepID=A0A6C2CR19_9RHOO|nr:MULTISPECIES: 50S ribosomal protein L25/general stress protein Ctc [Zoogloea]MBT9496606.1 50S ribosomal protein L25/general stress protein Ctc [Zoogloea sp.]MDD2668926.1 50S ribosomal protein L25/general stress protein Ctc [Zoogloea sp.]MDY0034616.1 50S ribosomal protein L25/general stress protein Ctc [Zoogloea oleivorans]TYC55929.1 50S ribosomal protein L25/general stress protein Ctc [Zoogloea oleivorans]
MTIQFNAKTRVLQGTSASRRLRRAGTVPAIIYGSGSAVQIEVDHNEIFHALRNEAFHASVLTVLLDGAAQSVILRDTQWHPYKQQVMHLDFQRVDATHKIHVKVPLHFVNADIAPGVKLEGGMVTHVMAEIDLECLPANLPEFIQVDLKDLASGHSIHVSDLVLPEGVKALVHGENPVVATILAIRGGSDAAEETSAA